MVKLIVWGLKDIDKDLQHSKYGEICHPTLFSTEKEAKAYYRSLGHKVTVFKYEISIKRMKGELNGMGKS